MVKEGHTRINRVYTRMMSRCYNPNATSYERYGGAGIKVCDRWFRNYKNFLEDMASTYADGLSIDRIDNNLGYSPENCRWATMEQQQNNRTNNRIIEYRGEEMTLAMWAKKLGIKKSTLYQRFHAYKWSVKQCLTTPTRKRG